MKAEVPLEALEGSSVALRLRATVGSGKLGQSWLSDIAIDDIKWSASACNVSANVVKATTNVAGCPTTAPFCPPVPDVWRSARPRITVMPGRRLGAWRAITNAPRRPPAATGASLRATQGVWG